MTPLTMADPSHGDTQGGSTALNWAAYNGEVQCVRLLVDGGADRWIRSNEGKTALNYAASKGHESIMTILRI